MDRRFSSPLCLLEKLFIEMGYQVVHDGRQPPDRQGIAQFTLLPEDIRFFVRKLRLFVDGRPQDKWAVFKYDLRRNLTLIDFWVVSREPNGVKREQRMALQAERK